jgi:hypothetical protein
MDRRDGGFRRDSRSHAAEKLRPTDTPGSAYGPGSPGVADLGHLIVGLWLDEREYRGAALLGRVLLARPCHLDYALSLAGMLARAAAALCWELTYESACQRALLCLGQLPPICPVRKACSTSRGRTAPSATGRVQN